MMKEKLKSLQSFLLLLMISVMSTATAWGDTEIFSANFTSWSNQTFVTNGEATVTTTPEELFVKASGSGKTVSITDNGLTFNSNMSSGNYFAAIKLTGINGSIDVSISHTYSNKKPTFRYFFVAGATNYSSPGSYSTTTAPASNGGNSTASISGIEQTVGILYIGAASSSYYSIGGITVTTPSGTPTCATPSISCTGNTVTITSATNGASIYYTTNGDTPTTLSTLYDP